MPVVGGGEDRRAERLGDRLRDPRTELVLDQIAVRDLDLGALGKDARPEPVRGVARDGRPDNPGGGLIEDRQATAGAVRPRGVRVDHEGSLHVQIREIEGDRPPDTAPRQGVLCRGALVEDDVTEGHRGTVLGRGPVLRDAVLAIDAIRVSRGEEAASDVA